MQRRQYRKILRFALITLKLSPWQKLLRLQFDADLVDRLLEKSGPMFFGHTPFDESGMIVEFEYTSG